MSENKKRKPKGKRSQIATEVAEKITDAEWRVMHVVWNREQVTANDVIDAVVPETNWSPNTVRTLLIRLTEKGVLRVEKIRQICRYTPLYTREECTVVQGQSFLERVFQGDARRLLVHFVKDAELTPQEVAELRDQLDSFSE